ncbi:hypothetical protein MMC08_006098 [Hypocenomyce scalaris]|nr:hypothetical protein [Hypocenomyce scalaris]
MAKVTTTTNLLHTLSRTRILSALHNHPLMIELNPLVISHHCVDSSSSPGVYELPNSTSTHRITDRVSYMPYHLWDSQITYMATFQNNETGLVTQVSAPLGVEIIGEWKLLSTSELSSIDHNEGSAGAPGGEEDWVLQETATVSCSILLMPFVKAQIQQSHEEMHQRFREQLEVALE